MIIYNDIPLAALEISGADASRFLQGQLTCNIDELTAEKSSIAAFCNAKGRVISTLLVIKSEHGFFLTLPRSLSETVQKKLQMYVLRSNVTIRKAANSFVIGLAGIDASASIPLPEASFECKQFDGSFYIRLPAKEARYLCLGTIGDIPDSTVREGAASNDEWRYLDISSGLPWFDLSRSEHYIPQMLNIDKLGGISFNKGCYTGQEIVARTHYLGQAKRQMYLAECGTTMEADIDLAALTSDTKTKCGDILASQSCGQTTRFLIVLQTVDDPSKSLILDGINQTPIRLLPFE